MGKKLALLLFVILNISVYSQFDIKGGMGIGYFNNKNLFDYINVNYLGYSDRLEGFNSMVNFSIEGGYFIDPETQLSLEVNYSINSYSYSFSVGKYELQYSIISPTVYYNYVIPGDGFYFKFGAGAGLRVLTSNEKIVVNSENRTSTGFGLALKGEGNTLLSGNFYANIGADIKYDFIKARLNNSTSINFNNFMLGLRLGVTYKF